MARFVLSKNGTGKKWIVTDLQTDPCEDPTIYTFSSKKKAIAFQDLMIEEYGNN